MKKLTITGVFLFSIIFICRYAAGQSFSLDYSDSFKNLTLKSNEVQMHSIWVSPDLRPALKTENWKHTGRSESYDKLSGTTGTRIIDVFINGGLEIERQLWISSDSRVVALRQKLTNKTKKNITLHSMTPLSCKGNDSFTMPGNSDAGKWKINVQKRLKNELPETVTPGSALKISADPFFAVPVRQDPQGRCLLVGYLDWTKHLASLDMSFLKDGGATKFSSLNSVCSFDDVIVPPGGTRITQWIYITVGEEFVATVNEYADRVAEYYNFGHAPLKAPSVFCTWYWYGKYYTEELFLKDIESLKAPGCVKPFDVFLIDECWQVGLWGDFTSNDVFPHGMKFVADKIKETGYIPGIWTPPFLVSPTSQLVKDHPEWVLKNSRGEHYIFKMNERDHWVIDLTYPGVLEHLEESFRKLSEDWGFRYFKLDFMRAVFINGDYKFYDPTVNRLEAYRMGLEAIRRGAGKDAYISVCGGHYGGSLGLADTQRSGSDVVSFWDAKEIPKYRQNIMRTWMSRFWNVDPDAMMVRRNKKTDYPGADPKLSLGLFTDDEARINALNQYVGGGLITFTENFSVLDNDRLELYKHIIPSVNSSSYPVDWYADVIPAMMVTRVTPQCMKLDKWNTLSIINWSENEKNISVKLDEHILKSLEGNRFLLFEFFSQKVVGLFNKEQLFEYGKLAPHSCLVIKIIPWDDHNPVLAGTDLHFSMGGVEISDWNFNTGSVNGTLETDWCYPVRITVAFPSDTEGYKVRQVVVRPGQKRFWINNDKE